MNFDTPQSASGKENFSNMQPNTGQAPFTWSQFNQSNPSVMQQFRPRLDPPHVNKRNEPINQQPTPQQRNTQPGYQQNPRFPGGQNPVTLPLNPTSNFIVRPNITDQNFSEYQRSSGSFPQGPRMQTGPQTKVQGQQGQMKPPVNYPNLGASNQPRLPNFQQMDSARPQNHNISPNQTLPQTENDQRLIYKDQPPILNRKSSNVEMNLSNDSPKLIRKESQSQLGISPENNAKSEPVPVSEPVPKEPQLSLKTSKYNQDELASALKKDENESEVEVAQNYTKPDKNIKKRNREEIQQDKSLEDDIKRGTVLQNIKFFENNDTAKTPLVPQDITAKKKERKVVSSADVVKCEFHEDKYESGVDETPIVYPNLGSIFDAPRKVAKIPSRRIVKTLRKLKSDKRSRPPFQVLFKSRQSSQKPKIKPSNFHLPHKLESSKEFRGKHFGPDEELLAFFESTVSWRKLKRYDSSRNDHKAVKNKLENNPKANGDIESPKKTPSKLPAPSKKNQPVSPARTPLKSPGTPGAISLPKTPDSPASSTPLIKKVPMNKIQVGAAPSPNLKTVKSKIGSLANTTHKPGGGNVKIESHKIDLSNAQARIEAKNDQYKRSGGDKKIQQVKLQWSAKPKIGSLDNATYKPGGGDKKIESVKLDFKEKAKPKVGSKDNVKHVPGGGNVKIENQKLEFKAQSKVGSLDNVKHKPGGGDVKIFDDKTYLRQISGTSSEGRISGTQGYGDLSLTTQAQGRSVPGTPGHKISVQAQKLTKIGNEVGIPIQKNVTERTTLPLTPKKEENLIKSLPKQVKVIYSKTSDNSLNDPKIHTEIIKLKTKNAPVLKPNLSKKDAFDVTTTNEKGKKVDFDNTSKDLKNFENLKQSSASSTLSENKVQLEDDTEVAMDTLDYTLRQEKVEKRLEEKNKTEDESFEWRQIQKQSNEISSIKCDNRPLIPPTQDNNFQKNTTHPRIPHYYSQQNLHPQEIYQPTPFTQSHQQPPAGQQRFTQHQTYNTGNFK